MQKAQRSRRFGVIALACFSFGAPCLAKQSPAGDGKPNGTFRVAGVVVSAKTGEPLPQARVTLASTNNRRDAVSLITHEDGRFEFGGLPARKYSLEGARSGYLPAAYEQHEQYSTAIVTGAEFDTQSLILRLVPMAVLTGSVIDENGEGVRNAQVRLYEESHRSGATRVVPESTEATDDQGTFEFAPLEPGRYYVSASAMPWYAAHAPTSTPVAGAAPAAVVDRSLDVAYPMTFFGGSTESEDAEALTVNAGDHGQIQIHLRPVQALTLSFHIPENSEHGYQLPLVQRRTFDTLEGIPFAGTQQTSSSPGVVEIIGLPPGRYSVRTPDNEPGKMKREGEVVLNQDGQDLNDWQGEPLGRVKLSVQMPKNDVLPKQVNIGLQQGQNRIFAFNQVDANGETTFEGLSAGKYGLRVFAPSKAYSVVRMTSGDKQVSGDEFTLKPGEYQEWTVWLATGKTRIEGFVKRASKPASGVMVVLVPNEPETHQDMFRRDQSDLDGSFALPAVIPGSYTVVAIEDAWGFDWSRPTLLARYAQHGQALTIGELMQGAVQLPDPVEVQPR